MSWYDWLVLVHVLAASVWIGGIAVLGAQAFVILRAGEPGDAGRFVRTLRRLGPVVLAPAPVLLVAAGVWMVGDSDAWSFDQTWIVVAFVLFGVAFVIGAAHQSRAALAAERAAARGDDAEAARRLRHWAWGMTVILALLVVAVWDMVAKPGL
jgi:uncharacterized membrane protein